MYLIYVALCLVSWVIVYLWIPETRRIALEEIGGLFGDTVVLHLTDDGHGIVEKDVLDGEGRLELNETGGADQDRANKETINVVHNEHLVV